MNVNEIKQELAKKIANMSYEEYESFKYDLDVMYAHKHPKIMKIDEHGVIWLNVPNAMKK